MVIHKVEWTAGFTASQLESAQDRYGLTFPRDLFDLLLDRNPVRGYNWAGDALNITKMLAWPLEMLLFDVDNGTWWPAWGERPVDVRARREIVRHAVQSAPKLIPLLGHRFLPETPSERGNPVISMHGFDTIYYGANLDEYFANETTGAYHVSAVREVPFWSDIIDDWQSILTSDQ